MAKYEVQKGRTVLTLKGTAHEGAIVEPKNFSGSDDEEKQKKIDAIVKLGALKLLPLSDAEKEALLEAEEAGKAKAKAKEAREAAILEADFDQMNKAPMIEFAETWEIDLNGKTADEIRAELKAVQETLTAPDE